MDWLAENWPLISAVACALLAYLAKRWGGAKGEALAAIADEIERFDLTGEKKTGEEFKQALKGCLKAKLSRAAARALGNAAAGVDAKKDNPSPAKEALRLIGTTVIENGVTNLFGRLFRRK